MNFAHCPNHLKTKQLPKKVSFTIVFIQYDVIQHVYTHRPTAKNNATSLIYSGVIFLIGNEKQSTKGSTLTMMYADFSAKKYYPIMLLSHLIRPSGCLDSFPHQPLHYMTIYIAPPTASHKKNIQRYDEATRPAK